MRAPGGLSAWLFDAITLTRWLGITRSAHVSDAAERMQPQNALGVITAEFGTNWLRYHSFMHIGFNHIAWYTGDVVTPSYPDGDVIRGLIFAVAVGLLAAVELATLSNNQPLNPLKPSICRRRIHDG